MNAAGPHEDIEALIAEFEKSGLRELHVRADGLELYLSKDPHAAGLDAVSVVGAAPVVVSSAAVETLSAIIAAPTAVSSWPVGAVIIGAPYLGTFYRSPKPGSEPYVEVGQTVAPENELCLVEVMKLFTSVRAAVAGVVHAVLAKDGDMVTPDQALFVIVPA